MINEDKLKSLYKLFIKSTGVSIDTRTIAKDNVWFAIKGPNFDANSFSLEAIRKGAKAAIVSDPDLANIQGHFYVDNVLQYLQAIATVHRKRFNIPIIAITGSNGKTTTKELMAAVLSPKYKVLFTQGNLNNHIGVPLTLLQMTKKTEIAIIEMGANKIGDIRELCHIARPNNGLITNIGKSHTEGFGGIQGVIKGKSELYEYLKNNDGRVFVNSDNEILYNLTKNFEKIRYYPKYNDYYSLELVDVDPFLVIKTDNKKILHTKLVGTYNFENIAAALTVAKFFDVKPKNANNALVKFKPNDNRSQIIKTKNNTIILDAYNANPSSMKAALSNLESFKVAHKGVILGDMLELEEEQLEHERIGKYCNKMKFSLVIFIGNRMRHAHLQCKESIWFENKEAFIKVVDTLNLKGKTLLIKASRTIGLEKLVEHL